MLWLSGGRRVKKVAAASMLMAARATVRGTAGPDTVSSRAAAGGGTLHTWRMTEASAAV